MYSKYYSYVHYVKILYNKAPTEKCKVFLCTAVRWLKTLDGRWLKWVYATVCFFHELKGTKSKCTEDKHWGGGRSVFWGGVNKPAQEGT